MEMVIKYIAKYKSTGTDKFASKFFQTFKETLLPIFFWLFQINEHTETLKDSFNEDKIILIQNADKDITEKDNHIQ